MSNRIAKYVEFVVQFLAIWSGVLAIDDATRWSRLQGVNPGDFMAYYNTLLGIYDPTFIYSRLALTLMAPLLWFSNGMQAFLFLSALSLFCFLILVHKLFQVKYGWIFAIIGLSQFPDLLRAGNITPILILVAIYPLASLANILFKPHYALFAFLHSIKTRNRTRNESSRIDKRDQSHFANASMVHLEE